MKKKLFAILMTLLALAALLGGCGAKVECDFCNEVKSCQTKTVLGEEVHICDDCQSELDGLFG